jgi:hypothetical protein
LGFATALLAVQASPALVLACAFPRFDHEADEAQERQRQERLEKWVRAELAAIPEIVRFGCEFEHAEEARAALTAMRTAETPQGPWSSKRFATARISRGAR